MWFWPQLSQKITVKLLTGAALSKILIWAGGSVSEKAHSLDYWLESSVPHWLLAGSLSFLPSGHFHRLPEGPQYMAAGFSQSK